MLVHMTEQRVKLSAVMEVILAKSTSTEKIMYNSISEQLTRVIHGMTAVHFLCRT